MPAPQLQGGAKQAARARSGGDGRGSGGGSGAGGSRGRTRSPRMRGGAKQAARGPLEPIVLPLPGRFAKPAHLAFRSQVANMFLKNEFSGKKAQLLMQNAAKAGASGAEDMGRAGASGRRPGNASRDLLRLLLKPKDMPELYWAKVPLKNGDRIEEVDLPFLLPHEMFPRLVAQTSVSQLKRDCDPALLKMFNDICASMRMPSGETIPIGLHGDGVPHQKHQSIEAFSWNFPGVPSAERILCAVVEKKFCCGCGCSGRHTTDAILEVLSWSLRCMSAGVYPTVRHDGSAWRPEDKARALLRGSLGARGLLCQIRGDWSWYKQVFDFPSWAGLQICWRCLANCSDTPWTDPSKGAAWRKNRMITDRQFWDRQAEKGIKPCPLFELPGFKLAMVSIDILHAVDLGVAQDMCGNILWDFVMGGFLSGKTKADRVKEVWSMLQKHYRAMGTLSRLDGLTVDMIKRDQKPPKLRATGSETRGIVPFCVQIAMQMKAESPDDPHYSTVASCAACLLDYYILLDADEWHAQAGQDACRRFCILYAALSKAARQQGDQHSWKQKPKLHLFQELSEYQTFELGHPARFWTYQDESFVGEVAQMATSRGGARAAATAARLVLTKYKALSAE